MATTSATASGRPRKFKAEVQKLLNIITHSIYTNREIFLRELISNGSDALDKLRFLQAKGETLREPETELSITIAVDEEAGTVTVTDTGVGMELEELTENLGTIAKSGSEAFLEQLKGESGSGADAAEIIGRFGVGFYSVFMVADSVDVVTRHASPDSKPYRWTSAGDGSFSVHEVASEDGEDVPRGTTVTLTLKDDAKEYASAERLKTVVKKHSSFVTFPVRVAGKEGEPEQVNTIKALWREPKFNVTDEEYAEFYKFQTHDPSGPLSTLHVSVDAPVQFNALCFVPKANLDPFGFDRNAYGLDLYVRRVLIQKENKDLIPEYLGFLKGVVDTEDLPLNISRETLQENVLIRKIAATLTKQALSHLKKLADEKPEDYASFFRAHGKVFKLGYSDFANRETIAELLRFESSAEEDGALTSLAAYTERMKTGQKAIYYASGPSRAAIGCSPHLDIFRKKGVEVLYLYEPIDEFVMEGVREYKEKFLVAAEHADLDELNELPNVETTEAGAEETPELTEEESKNLDTLVAHLKDVLGERVAEIRVSKRLAKAPACLVSPDGAMTSQMEKIMRLMQAQQGNSTDHVPPKVLELNPTHPLTKNLLRVHAHDPQDPVLAQAAEQLLESALLLDGYISDPHELVGRMQAFMTQATGWYADLNNTSE